MEYTKEQLRNVLKAQIGKNPAKAVRAMLTIYGYQTEEEVSEGRTIEHNGVGFSGCDSEILTSLCEQWIARRYLSEKQMRIVTRIMPRYAGQLLALSFAKGNFEKSGRKWVIRK